MKILRFLFIAIFCIASINTNAENNDESKVSEIEYAVKQINRICPTYMWDSWYFRDIIYDRKLNTVYFVIQPTSWNEGKENISPKKIKGQTNWIVENFREAYESIISDKSLYCDGDFMLYLSIGTLLHNLPLTDTKLQVVLLKPDKDCVIHKDTPMVVDRKEINKMSKKK